MAVLNRDNRRGPAIRRNRAGREKENSELDNLNAQISENEKRIGILYNEMGEMYFRLHRKDAEEPFRQHISAIEEMMAQNEHWNDQIQTLRGLVKCPHCGSYVPNNVVYCTACGSRVIPETSKICPQCGLIVDRETMFCPRCGTRVPDEEPNSKKTVSAAQVTCRACGAVVDADSLFCPVCGSRIEETAVQESPEAAGPHPESKSEVTEPEPAEARTAVEPDVPTDPEPAEVPEDRESDLPTEPEPADGQTAVEPDVPTEPKTAEDRTTAEPDAPTEPKTSEVQEKAPLRCPSCGFLIEPGDLFCSNCGCAVPKEPKKAEPAPESKSRRCPNCGAEVDEDSVFCMKCGTRL